MNNHSPAKGLIHDMIFRTDGKPSTSHLFDVRDTINGNGNTRPSHQYLEERTWLPGEMVGNQRLECNIGLGSFHLIGSSSSPLSKTTPTNPASTDSTLGWKGSSSYYHNDNKIRSNSHDPFVINGNLETRSENPYQLAVVL